MVGAPEDTDTITKLPNVKDRPLGLLVSKL